MQGLFWDSGTFSLLRVGVCFWTNSRRCFRSKINTLLLWKKKKSTRSPPANPRWPPTFPKLLEVILWLINIDESIGALLEAPQVLTLPSQALQLIEDYKFLEKFTSSEQGRNQDFAKGGLKMKFLRRHFNDVF